MTIGNAGGAGMRIAAGDPPGARESVFTVVDGLLDSMIAPVASNAAPAMPGTSCAGCTPSRERCKVTPVGH